MKEGIKMEIKKEQLKNGISFIAMLQELQEDSNKVFKSVDERGGKFEPYEFRYTIENDKVCSFSIDNKRNLKVVEITIERILKITTRFIETKQFCEYIEIGEEYFYIDRNLEIQKDIYLGKNDESSKTKLSENMFKKIMDAEESLNEFTNILKVN